jgi:hypothetical protein
MPEELSKHDQVLLTLAMNLQGGAMVQLGKLADPISGEVTRNLDGARYAIDVLEMLQAKCRDNTDAEIVGMLDRLVMDLQLNYMDETKRDQAAAEDTEATEEPPADASTDEPPADEASDEAQT